MTKEIFERAVELNAEINQLMEMKFLFRNMNENRQLVLKDVDGHIINQGSMPAEGVNVCLSAIQKLINLKNAEFENL